MAHNEGSPQLEPSVRRTCRHVAAAIIEAMAETDASIESIAAKLGVPARLVRSHLNRLINGDGSRMGMRWLAEIAVAMGCTIRVQVYQMDPDEWNFLQSAPAETQTQKGAE